jgi:hypothetical protein
MRTDKEMYDLLWNEKETLRIALMDVLSRTGFMLSPEVCALLYHPKFRGKDRCPCKQAEVSSGPIISVQPIVFQECKESPDGKHCYHDTTPASICYIPGGVSRTQKTCCWCGEVEETEVKLPFSYSVTSDTTNHGKHCPRLYGPY